MPTVTVSKNTGADYAGMTDTEMNNPATTTNFSGYTHFYIKKWAAGDHAHAIVNFDVSSIGAGQTVSASTLTMTALGFVGSAHTIDARRILRDVVQAQTTWVIWKTSNNWATAGGLGAGTDRVDAVSGVSASITATGAWTWSSGLTSDVEGWINGTYSNYGWHLERTGTGNDSKETDWHSATGTDGSRPSLSITYTATAAGHPTMRRWGGVPHMAGGQQVNSGGTGKMWAS